MLRLRQTIRTIGGSLMLSVPPRNLSDVLLDQLMDGDEISSEAVAALNEYTRASMREVTPRQDFRRSVFPPFPVEDNDAPDE